MLRNNNPLQHNKYHNKKSKYFKNQSKVSPMSHKKSNKQKKSEDIREGNCCNSFFSVLFALDNDDNRKKNIFTFFWDVCRINNYVSVFFLAFSNEEATQT